MKNRHSIRQIDYSKLPRNRKEQFKDILHNDFALIVDVSLLDLLFSLPLYVLLFLEFSMIATLNELTMDKVFPVVFYLGLISIPLFAIKGLSKGASYGLFARRIYNEGCILVPTFFKLIKNNFLHYFFCYLLVGISYFVTSIGITYFIYLNLKPIVNGLGIGILLLFFMIIYVLANYFLSLDNTYELTFMQGINNAISFTFISFLSSFVYFLIALVIPVILITLSNWLLIAIFTFYVLFYDGFMMLIASLFSISRFDLYINKENYPEYYNRGLLKEDVSCQN